MSTDSNSLAREFLTDVNWLCNAVVQRVEAREEEEEETHMATLGDYLVHGRGFLLLTKLNSIIDQALTCREELLTLLLSLLPLVWKIPVQEEKAADFNLPLSADIILTKEKNSSSQRSTQEKLYSEGSAPSGQVPAKVSVFRKSRRPRKITHRYSIRDARKTQLSTSDSEANSDDKSMTVSKHRRPRLLQHFVTQSPKEDYLAAKLDHLATKEQAPPGTMALENSKEVLPRQESNTDILSEPAALSILSHMNNSPFDLCHVLLSLLEKVCKFDMTLNHNSALAATVVPTLTEFLAGFGDCCNLRDSLEGQMVSAGWTEEPVALVQRMLFRTVLHLLSVDISTAEAMPENLRKNLTELLRAALKIRTCLEKQPDPFAPRQKRTLQEVREGFVFSKYRHRALLLPELLEGVLQILICCLQSAASNPFFFSQAMDLVQEFIQHHGFNLFETAVLQMEWLVLRDGVPAEAAGHLKALINSVMKIMSTIKKVKSEQLHHSVCTRKRHRRCEYSHFMHHHRDLSGLLVSAFKNQVSKNPFEETADGDVYYPERCCCIAVCAHQCLRLLQHASLSSTCIQILSGVHGVGVCCCMDPKSVIIPLLHAFRSPALKNFQQHILTILNKLILDQLGGAEIPQKMKKAACNICTIDPDQVAKLEEALQGSPWEAGPSPSPPSPVHRSEGILPSSGSEDWLWRWGALEAYQSFVFEEDQFRSVQIANHICNLIQKGNVVVRWKLYNCIFNPVLQRGVELAHHCQLLSVTSAQAHVCSHHNQCLPPEVLQIYLKTLPALLKSRVIRDLFLSHNGVNQIIELNYLDDIRSHSLKAFETLIISLGEQQKDSSIPGIDGIDGEQKELPSLNAGTSFHNQQAYSDSPQSLSKFYAILKEAYPKKRKSVNQDVHINMINLFLCVAFLCVSKEAESDRESANDSEDTSDYDSTASEPLHHLPPCLSPKSLVLPSPKHMHQAADIWSMCRWIYMLSPVFQKQFHRLGGFQVCHKLIFMIIQKLFRSREEEQGRKEGDLNVCENQNLNRTSQSEIMMKEDLSSLTIKRDPTPSGLGSPKHTADSLGKLEAQHISSKNTGHVSATEVAPEEAKVFTSQERQTSLQSIRLLEALLAICLHSTRASPQKVELELPNQNLSVENILFEMRDHLFQSEVIETELAKPLFDALLRVALGNHSVDFDHHDAVTEKSLQSEEELSSQPGDFSEEAEDSQCCSLKLLVEEEGYEADSESNPEDSETRDDGVDLNPEAEVVGASGNPEDLLENLTDGEIIYPEIFMLELNLLSTGKAKLDVLAHVFESFLKIIRQKEKNIFLLMQQGTVKNLLGGFLSILTQADSDFQACQRVLVGLLVSLMSSRTSSEELTLLLRIFLEKSPCTEVLLLGILKIIESDITMSPSQYLTFPLLHTPNVSNGVSSQKSPGILNSKALGLLLRAQSPRGRKEASGESFPQQLLSSWYVAPVHLPLLGQNCWPHLSEGFSVSLWFSVERIPEAESAVEKGKKIKKRSKSSVLRDGSLDDTENNRPEGAEYINPGERLIEEGCIHMISLGSKALMMQVWADPHNGTFIFRMCMDPNDDMKATLLAQVESQENVFVPSRWQHLVLTYLQQPQGKKSNHGKISMWVSGQRKPDVTLDFVLPRRTSLSSDSNKTFCMIGHCCSSQEEFLQLAGKWDLGNLLLFNGAKIDSQEAFYLYACGPNHTSIMPCKYGKPVNDFSKYINKDILRCEQIRELFMTKKEVDIGLLIESLSVVYTTNCPAQYTIYEPVIRLKGQMKTQLSQRPFSSKEVQSILLEPHYLKSLRPTECKTIQGVLHEIGGTGIFVFLFARVVELSSCEETQALALRVILALIKYNQQRIHELENCNGLSMIHQVLIKQKCVVGFHVLKTLLEGCCGEDIIHINENGEFKLDVESNAIIQDVKLLEELLLDWKIWNKAKHGAWEALLAALEVLIRADHQQQVFNIKQLLKARVVHHFLLTCQVLQEHKEGQLTSMPREVCRSFVKIIAEVLGSPPDLELLTIIFNFLLAVHPPTNTYVCHNPTNFYFSLHIDGKIFQEKVQSIMYLRHSSSGGKSVTSPGFMVISPSGFSASPSEGNSSSRMIPQRMTANMLRSRSLPAFPTASPQTQPQKLTGSLGCSIDELQNIAGNYIASQEEKLNSLASSETLKKDKEDAFISSCESAKTVCEMEPVLSAHASVNAVPKGSWGFPGVKVDHRELGAEPRSEDDSPGDESCPRRPDHLKGLASFQRSHSTVASLGLAFPSQNGSSAVGRWPSLVDRNPDDWDNFAFSLGYEPHSSRTASTHSVTEDCLVPICCGLYELLSGVLLILPDVMLQDVMDKLIQADTLLVLVNHPSPAIQQGVIKLLDAYFNRASKEQKDKFLKNRGFSLLANQLYLHRGTQELLECFIEMFFGRRIGLNEEFDLEDVKNIGLFQKWSVIPVLGLIETSLYDNMLLHSTLLFLLQMLNSCSKVADLLLDNGLLYVLCNTVAALNGLEKNVPLNEYKLLACDIQQLFIAVTIHACSSSGPQYFRVIEDLIVLLGYLQNSKNKRTQSMAVALQFRVLQAAMEFIRTTANHDPESLADPFQLPSPPHHAMFRQRKSIAGARKFPLAQTDSLLTKMRSVASDELHVMMQRRMSHENPVQATEAELAQRLQRLTILAVNRIIYQEFNPDIIDILSTPENATQSKTSVSQNEITEENIHHEQPSVFNPFQKEIFTYLVEGFKASIGSSKTSGSKQQWTKILCSCKETFRMQLGRLLVHILSPAHSSQERKQIFEILREPNHQEILRDCLSPSLQHGAKLILYLSELIHNHQDELTEEELDTAELLMSALKLCGHKSTPPSAATKADLIKMIKEEQKKYETEESVNKATWQKTVNNNQQSLFQRLDSKSKDISKIAADVTQAVSLSQGMERKKVIQHIRGMYKVDLSASRHWQELIQQLTHDRAAWYDPLYYPTSWQLDPTEGPNRERRRLQRCYLTIPNKYLLRDRQKSEDVVKPPLSFLFEDKTHSSFSSTVKDKAASESIRVNRRCISVAPSRETAGELLLGKCGMYFVEDNASDTVESSSLQGELEPASFSWTYEEIKEVHKRWWQLRDNAVEIFLTNGRTLLLAFDNTKAQYFQIILDSYSFVPHTYFISPADSPLKIRPESDHLTPPPTILL
ncbi:lysosomal-trafficking regulator isoform X2 [Suricata suricatta]|uniref:lysosomal-trafficking regulator isoform X2 n=1 Tax=Suricata suricatta TaxID=37032 RepID=UPI00115536D7|nr:lysosomal-trafficking regulator isoform X2 [Suricata suricatta]